MQMIVIAQTMNALLPHTFKKSKHIAACRDWFGNRAIFVCSFVFLHYDEVGLEADHVLHLASLWSIVLLLSNVPHKTELQLLLAVGT